ncbi:MAG: rRNA maturation RNase YbeY [Bacteroidia bacterium]
MRFHSEYPRFKLLTPLLRKRWLTQVILIEKKQPGTLNFIFCSDDYLFGINKQYLQHDYFTDIITFDYTEGRCISGDLFISIDRVRDNALTLKTDFETELSRVLVHGVLHLLGHSDKGPALKALMRKKEDKYLSLLGKK